MDAMTAAIIAVVFVFAAAVFLFILYSLIKQVAKFFYAILANSIVGLIALAVLSLLGINVPITAPVVISIALFGLGGLGAILVLMFFGVSLR